MNAKKLERWRNHLLTRLENLRIDARQIQQLMEARGQDVLEDKAHFAAQWQRIYELFPEDFEPNRAGDLGRHVSFAHLHDFSDIENFDIPAVIESVQRYGREGDDFIAAEMDRVHVGLDAAELLHPLINDACSGLIAERQFCEAAQRAVGLLMDELRRLSGQDADGDVLIRQVVGTQPGRIAFSDCVSNNSKAVTEGLKQVT